jgi:hypothetical protein
MESGLANVLYSFCNSDNNVLPDTTVDPLLKDTPKIRRPQGFSKFVVIYSWKKDASLYYRIFHQAPKVSRIPLYFELKNKILCIGEGWRSSSPCTNDWVLTCVTLTLWRVRTKGFVTDRFHSWTVNIMYSTPTHSLIVWRIKLRLLRTFPYSTLQHNLWKRVYNNRWYQWKI